MNEDDKKRKTFSGRTVLILGAAALVLIAISSFSEANIMQIYGRDGRTQWFINDSINATFVGIGTAVPQATLDVNGTIMANGSFVCTVANGLCASGSFAPDNAQYLTLAASAGLSNERILTPGSGILLEDFGANGNLRVNVSATTCSASQASRWNGTAFVCITPGSGSGDIEGVTAGTGLTGGGTSGNVTLNANTTYLQRRVNETCAAGSSIRVINDDGTVTCETDSVGSNNYPVSISVTGTTTKNISIERNGLANISATFTQDAFIYNDYFNQNLNTTNNVTFNRVDTNNIRSLTSAGLLIETLGGLDIVEFGSGNTNNTGFYGSISVPIGHNICLGGDCRAAWPSGNTTAEIQAAAYTASFYVNVTNLQTADNTQNSVNQQLAANISSINSSLGGAIAGLQSGASSQNTTNQLLAANISAVNTSAQNAISVNALQYTNITILQSASSTQNTTNQQLAANISSVNSTLGGRIAGLEADVATNNLTHQQLAANITSLNATKGNISGGSGATSTFIAFFNNGTMINGSSTGIFSLARNVWEFQNVSVIGNITTNGSIKLNTSTTFANGTLFYNSTCNFFYSPNGATRIEVCN